MSNFSHLSPQLINVPKVLTSPEVSIPSNDHSLASSLCILVPPQSLACGQQHQQCMEGHSRFDPQAHPRPTDSESPQVRVQDLVLYVEALQAILRHTWVCEVLAAGLPWLCFLTIWARLLLSLQSFSPRLCPGLFFSSVISFLLVISATWRLI